MNAIANYIESHPHYTAYTDVRSKLIAARPGIFTNLAEGILKREYPVIHSRHEALMTMLNNYMSLLRRARYIKRAQGPACDGICESYDYDCR